MIASETRIEFHPLLSQAFGITNAEINETIKDAEQPQETRDMFQFLSDYAEISDPATRPLVSDMKLNFIVANMKRRMGNVAEFYRKQAAEYSELEGFMKRAKVQKLQTVPEQLLKISETAKKLSMFSGQSRADKIVFIDAIIGLEHTSGSVIPVAFGIEDYGRDDYWPRKLIAYLRVYKQPEKKESSMVSEPIDIEFRANPNLINTELAMRSHSGTSFSPEKRGEQEISEFASYVQEVYEHLKKHAKTDTQREYLLTEMARFQSTFADKYNTKLSSQGSCMSTMIAGPSNFPVSRAQKACSAADKRYEELIEFRDRAEAAILRELKKMAVEEAGGEIEVLKKKVEQAEKLQEAMKLSNSILRKKIPDEAKMQEIIKATGFQEATVRKMFIPDYMGRTGFPAFELQNNNANIRRMKERVLELEKKEATPSADIAFEGGTIHDSKEDDRIQIFFDQKPPQEMINKLKSEGWRWAPSIGAWSRKRTDSALYSARRILGLEAKGPVFVSVKEPPKIDEEVHTRIQKVIEIMKIYRDKGTDYEDFLAGLKGYYLEQSGYVMGSNLNAQKLIDDLKKSGYNNLRELWRKIIVQAPEKEIPAPFLIPERFVTSSIPLLYPAPQAELRWVYGTQSGLWHLVGLEDRDYAHGITQERMKIIGQEAAKAEYLNPSLARAAPLQQVPETKKYYIPRIFPKGTIARNNLNEKFVLESDVEALQQDKNAKIWKTNDGIYIYTDDQLPAPTPPKPDIITPEDERLLKGYENYTDDAIQKLILLNEGKLKVLASRKLERIEQGKYGTMGSAYIEQERLGISQENSGFIRVLELRKLKATAAKAEPWKQTQEEYWRAGAGGRAFEGRRTSDFTHKGQVVLALAQGKPVPPNVLQDYPDIVARIRQENVGILAKERAERERIRLAERVEESELVAELMKLPPALRRHAETEIYSTLRLPETHKDYRNRFYIALGKVRSIASAHMPGETAAKSIASLEREKVQSQPAAVPAPVPKIQSTQDIKQQVLNDIQTAKNIDELKQVLKGIGFLPLGEADKRQLMDAYQNHFTALQGEMLFGVAIKTESGPRLLGAPSRQEITEREARRRAEEGKKLKGQQSISSAVSTSRRLEEFGIKESMNELSPSMSQYIQGATRLGPVIYHGSGAPLRGELFRARDMTYFVEAQDNQIYASMGWERV